MRSSSSLYSSAMSLVVRTDKASAGPRRGFPFILPSMRVASDRKRTPNSLSFSSWLMASWTIPIASTTDGAKPMSLETVYMVPMMSRIRFLKT